MPDHSQPKEGCAIVHRCRAQSAAGATAPHTYHCQVPGCKWRGFTQSAAWNHARRSHEQLEYVLWWELTSAETRREQNRRSQAKKRAAHQERARGEQQEALSVLALCLLETAGGGAVGLATSCYIMTRAGGGRRLIKGHVEPGLVEHAEVALSFAYASLSHGPLGRWLVAVPESTSTATAAASSSSSSSSAEPALAPEARRALTPQRQDEDVVVYHAEARVRKDGGSAGAAMALLAVCRSTGALPIPGVAITGGIDLEGRVLAVDGLVFKLKAAMEAGAARAVGPLIEVQMLKRAAGVRGGMHPGLADFILSKTYGAADMLDVITHAVQGFVRTEGMRLLPSEEQQREGQADGAAGDGRSRSSCSIWVGSGTSLGLLGDDLESSRPYRVQCCSYRPGKGHCLITGGLSKVMKESFSVAYDCVVADTARLSRLLNDAPVRSPPYSSTADMHIHGPLDWQEEECCLGQVSFYGGACAVALISLVFGIRPKPGVAVLGMLLPLRQLHSVEPLSGEVVRRAVAQRFHTLVVAERVRWADDGVKAAADAEGVRLLPVGRLDEAFAVLFDEAHQAIVPEPADGAGPSA